MYSPRRRFLKQIGGGLAASMLPWQLSLARPEGRDDAVSYRRDIGLHRFDPDASTLVGRLQRAWVYEGDTLLDVARRYDLGYWDIVLANPGVDFWLPPPGPNVLVPRQFILPDAPHEGIVVNVAEMRLYYYLPPGSGGIDRFVITHPVGIGRQDWSTPLGESRVVEKIPEPTWYPPASIRAERAAAGNPLPAIVPPGPDNPLGDYALILDLPGYLIHGTNQPAGVGMRVSHGCIRLYPEDIEALFPIVPRGTPVRIVNQPYKLAWHRGELFTEIQPMPGADDYVAMTALEHMDLFAALFERAEGEARRAGRQLPISTKLQRQRLLTGVPQKLALV